MVIIVSLPKLPTREYITHAYNIKAWFRAGTSLGHLLTPFRPSFRYCFTRDTSQQGVMIKRMGICTP